ncbi:MAG: helix-turn-helix domain-containing protein [Spirochaetaceae bacterium]|nr:helix-turn-helix domain-containing protein [Spirochaetaceae bacterium]
MSSTIIRVLSYLVCMGFNENLKSQLQFSGMLVKELAARSGVKKKTLDSYLTTQSYSPSVETAVRIAQALGVSVEYLVNGMDAWKGRHLSSLPQDIQDIVRAAEFLGERDRQVILTLANSLKSR